MKKTILALFVLLFLLIFTCVYQKTDVLYKKYQDKPSTIVETIITTPNHPVAKKLAPIVEAVVEVIPVPTPMQVPTPTPIPTQTPILKVEKAKVEKAKVEKAKVEKTKVIETLKADVLHQAMTQAAQPTLVTPAIDERERAFKNRAAFELYLEKLIEKALKNRDIAISTMNQESQDLLEVQKGLLKARDDAYNQITQTNTPKSGE